MLVNVFDGNWNGGYLVDGGRNLLIGSTRASVNQMWRQYGWRGTFSTYNSDNRIYKLTAENGWHTAMYTGLNDYINKALVVSFTAKCIKDETSATESYAIGCTNAIGSAYFTDDITSETPIQDTWFNLKHSCQLNSDGQFGLGSHCAPEGADHNLKATWLIKDLKIELGTVATPWTPAPEDTFEEGTKHPNSIFTNTIPVKKKYQYTYGFLNQNSMPAHTIRFMKPDGTWVKAVHVNEDATSGMKSLEIDDDYNIEIMFQNGLTDAQKASFKIMEENFMAIKASNQVSVIDITDGYSVILTNDSYTFLGDTDSVSITQSTTSQIVAMRGSEILSCTIGEVTCPNGLSVVSDNKTPSPTLTITATSALTKAGTIDIPIKIGDVTIVKKFSFAIAFTGAKGDKGDKGTGVTIKSKAIEYLAGSSGTTAPTGTWSPTIPTVSQGQYLWTRTTVTYSDGNQTVSYSAARQGVNGTSPTVSSSKVQYQQSTSGTTVPTGTWADTPPAAVAGQYMWSKTTATYSDGKTAVSYNVTRNGSNGAKGDKGDKGAAGADALALVITSSAGVIFKNTAISTTFTAHVYKGGVEVTGSALTTLGTIKWYKDGGTTAVATGQTYTISAGDVENKANFTAQLEG